VRSTSWFFGFGYPTVYPVRGYGEQWRLYEPLIHGGHHKLEMIVEDDQVDNVVEERGSTQRKGDGILSVLDLESVASRSAQTCQWHGF